MEEKKADKQPANFGDGGSTKLMLRQEFVDSLTADILKKKKNLPEGARDSEVFVQITSVLLIDPKCESVTVVEQTLVPVRKANEKELAAINEKAEQEK